MSRISQEKKNKIKEMIISLLFSKYPYSLSTTKIAKELARDEEFVKSILLEMEKEKFLKRKEYSRKVEWQLTEKVYETYKKLIKS